MEPHPVPQNVTSFQFKLVGDMTLKQFMYLAIGVGMAYLIFVFFAHDYPFVAWPLIITSALLGAGFAFLPVGSRPLDYWLAAFLKAVYSPTKRVWKKNGKTFKEDPLYNSRLVMYISGINAAQPASQPISQPSSAQTALQPAGISNPQPANLPNLPEIPALQPDQPLPTSEELQKTVDLARQAQQLQMKIIQTERTLSQIKDQARQPIPVPIDYSQQVNKILADLQNLINQASEIKRQIQSVQEPQPKAETPSPPPIVKEKIKIVMSARPKQTEISLTTFPNVINGIVKDKRNNYLAGVVAVIYDKEGLPVRALKTNKLGQFTSSTPLPNGTYTLELEKDDFTFDVLQLELTGQVLSPLLIAAKE
ncbi:PrgI family protein [Patescibacteria group bacterium]|nr:PrgI family protein [Patescibacteria group bacterium]